MRLNACSLLMGLTLLLMAVMSNAQIITEVTSAAFYENHMALLEEETTVLIDGRSQEMFEKEHIAGAFLIDAFQDGFLPKLSSFAGKTTIVIYCTTKRRSTVLVEALKSFYTGHIYCICDGITGWKENGLPLVK